MSCDKVLGKLSENFNSRLLVHEEYGFQKGAQCATGAQIKPGLDRVKVLPALRATISVKNISLTCGKESNSELRTLKPPTFLCGYACCLHQYPAVTHF